MPIPLLLAPLLSSLAANGLNTLAAAITTKGKEVIEEKLGINIEKAIETPEGLQKLKQAEIDHEEFLITAATENRKIDLQFATLDLENTKSAREMETRVQESEHASVLAKNIVPILAIIVVAGGGAGIIFHPDDSVRMALVGLVTMVLGFYFGTSIGSKGKDATNAALATALAKKEAA